MNNPTVSVIMPVYNAEKYLEEAVESILVQTLTEFEFIIINDGSSDKSSEIIDSYKKRDKRIIVIERENKGLIASLNEGIALANGRYIARMDADDISLSNRFKRQVELLESGYDICGCCYNIINENGKLLDTTVTPTSPEGFLITLSQSVPFAHGSVMFSAEFLHKHQLYYEKNHYSAAEDYLLWTKFYDLKAKMNNVEEVLFEYRELKNSLSHKSGSKNVLHAYSISKDFIKRYRPQIVENIKEGYEQFTLAESEHAAVTLFYLLVTFRLGLRDWSLIKKFPLKFKANGFLKALHLIFKCR